MTQSRRHRGSDLFIIEAHGGWPLAGSVREKNE